MRNSHSHSSVSRSQPHFVGSSSPRASSQRTSSQRSTTAHTSSHPRRTRSRWRSYTQAGWLPNYHGAWAMITLPVILGIFSRGTAQLHWRQLLLAICWWAGYFAFFAGTLCLKTRLRKTQLFRPLFTYASICAVAGLILLLLQPALLWWIPFFCPLLALSAWAAWTHNERSVSNDLGLVLAACAVLPIGAQLGEPSLSVAALSPKIWIATLLLLLYFAGTVFYVKTNIRKRTSHTWLVLSISYHGFALLLVVALFTCSFIFSDFFFSDFFAFTHCFAFSWVNIAFLILWGIIFLRAILVPLYGRMRRFPNAKFIGIGEFAISAVLFVLLLYFFAA